MNRIRQSGKSVVPGEWVPGRRTGGFSLIEVLAAMSVLAIIMMLTAQIFGDSTKAMRTGLRGAESGASSRAVMDFMARDVSLAAFGSPGSYASNLVLRAYNDEPPAGNMNENNILGLRTNDFRTLLFLSPINSPDKPREFKCVEYWMRNYKDLSTGEKYDFRYELMRGEWGRSDINWYATNTWHDSDGEGFNKARSAGQVLIPNVRSFSVAYRTNFTGTAVAETDPAKTRTDVTPLAYLDIRLEVLAEADAIRAADMWATGTPSQAALEFVERAVRHHFRRVFFNNQGGYATPGRF